MESRNIHYVMGTKPVWVSLLFLFSLISCSSSAIAPQDPDVVWNRVGYFPGSEKWAAIRNTTADTFKILNAEDDSIYYTGSIEGEPVYDSLSGDQVLRFDFSDVRQEGRYKIHIPDLNFTSAAFTIGYDMYDDELKHALRSYYLQRCGTEITDEDWSRTACHLNDAPLLNQQSQKVETTGGWHDAGDYNKFVVTTAVSAGMLMQLYELDPDHFGQFSLNIPESGNGMPDLLDEVKWALDWLLRMQKDDGGVYFKVSQKGWTGEYLPQKDPETRYIFEVSSTATAGTAAVLAQGARLFKPYNATYASRLLDAAQKSWSWLEKYPDIVPEGGFTNPEGVHGGEYHDWQDLDERLWASAELYKTTGGSKYLDFFSSNYTSIAGGGFGFPILSWQSTGSLAMASILSSDDKPVPDEIRNHIINRSKQYGDDVLQQIDANPYRYVLTEDNFYWGSNSVAMGYTFDLVNIWRATGEDRFRDAAAEQLDYIFGRNPFGLAYVTSERQGWVQQPYHQWVMTSGKNKPLEGMLVGGPNNRSEMRRPPNHSYPARWYRDDHKEYTVNEVAINYTAPHAYVLGFFTLSEDRQLITQYR